MKPITDPTFRYEPAASHSTTDAFRERMRERLLAAQPWRQQPPIAKGARK